MELLSKLSDLTLDLHRAVRCETPDAFVAWVFAALERILRFDSGFWGTGHVGDDRRLVLHTRHLHRQPPQMMVDDLQIGHLDVLLAESMRRPGESITADIPSGAPPEMRDHLRRYGIAQALATSMIEPLTGLCIGFVLWRSDPAHPYTEEERLLMQAIFPHLIEARTQNRLLRLVQATTPRASGTWLPAAADRQGLLHHADDEFIRLLREEWPGWTGPRLPAPLEQRVHKGAGERYYGQRLVCKFDAMGDLALVQVRRGAAVDRLTPREREIAVYTAQGLTHKEIARLLELAPTTVRTHLTASCRRLGARNKAQMAVLVHSLE
jgi:DNA-binding CsgD family transcriptional regulator